MDFLRRHGLIIGCALASIVGIALGVTGLNAMPKVGAEMKKVETVYRNLEGLQSGAVNYERIEAEKRRIDLLVEDRKKIMETARALYRSALEKVTANGEETYRYKLLVPDVVPNGGKDLRIKFQRAYESAMDELLKTLNSGGPAKADEIARIEDRIKAEQVTQRERSLDSGGSEMPPEAAGQTRTPAGVLTVPGVRENANARADIAAAQRIYCYAVGIRDEKPPIRFSSLDFNPAMRATGTADAPPIEEVWRAQVGYWIQKDVVDAIAALNNEAAEEARKNGEDQWVGIMPVKEIISIRVGDYVSPSAEELEAVDPPSGHDPATPPGTAASVFTRRGSGPSYEVIQYSLKMVMDQRDIPALVDRICKDSFHTPLRIAYEAVPPNKSMTGKIYGSEPTVNVVMDFEVVMLGEVFRRLLPPAVREADDFIKCRDIDECPKIEEEG